MAKYVCTVCGYIYDESNGTQWKDLPEDWVCPLCGAGKDAFELVQETNDTREGSPLEFDEDLRELQPYEMAALCSNLAKGCEKQYLFTEAQAFLEMEHYFNDNVQLKKEETLTGMLNTINDEIANTFNQANKIVDDIGDRGAKRALVWSEKVTRMLKAILSRYEKDGDSYLENTKVFVCEICGFIYVGNKLPKVCPVCKVPNFKMKEIGRD